MSPTETAASSQREGSIRHCPPASPPARPLQAAARIEEDASNREPRAFRHRKGGWDIDPDEMGQQSENDTKK